MTFKAYLPQEQTNQHIIVYATMQPEYSDSIGATQSLVPATNYINPASIRPQTNSEQLDTQPGVSNPAEALDSSTYSTGPTQSLIPGTNLFDPTFSIGPRQLLVAGRNILNPLDSIDPRQFVVAGRNIQNPASIRPETNSEQFNTQPSVSNHAVAPITSIEVVEVTSPLRSIYIENSDINNSPIEETGKGKKNKGKEKATYSPNYSEQQQQQQLDDLAESSEYENPDGVLALERAIERFHNNGGESSSRGIGNTNSFESVNPNSSNVDHNPASFSNPADSSSSKPKNKSIYSTTSEEVKNYLRRSGRNTYNLNAGKDPIDVPKLSAAGQREYSQYKRRTHIQRNENKRNKFENLTESEKTREIEAERAKQKKNKAKYKDIINARARNQYAGLTENEKAARAAKKKEQRDKTKDLRNEKRRKKAAESKITKKKKDDNSENDSDNCENDNDNSENDKPSK